MARHVPTCPKCKGPDYAPHDSATCSARSPDDVLRELVWREYHCTCGEPEDDVHKGACNDADLTERLREAYALGFADGARAQREADADGVRDHDYRCSQAIESMPLVAAKPEGGTR